SASGRGCVDDIDGVGCVDCVDCVDCAILIGAGRGSAGCATVAWAGRGAGLALATRLSRMSSLVMASTMTWPLPGPISPSLLAATYDKSMMRELWKGPRSLMRTMTDLPEEARVTRA